MKREIHLAQTALSLTVGLFLVLAAPPAAPGATSGSESCQSGSPAHPVDEFRTIGAQTYDMWPDSLEPVNPGQTLPAARDSTQYTGFELPGFGGLEFFYDLDIVESPGGTYLYMSYNAGFQIWDITGTRAANPVKLSDRNGWFNDFHDFPDPPTEFYFKIWDIAAIDPAGAAGNTLVVLPGETLVGLTIWDATNKSNPFQYYQDLGKTGLQVAAANIGGRSYAFLGANDGVHVYDMTRAREIGTCFEDTSTATNLCGGNGDPVWRGRLGPWPFGKAAYLAVLETSISGPTRHFIAVSDATSANPLGVAIREITDITTLTPTSTALIDGLETFTFGVELFALGGNIYLALTDLTDLEIYDVTGCVTGVGCSLTTPVVSLPSALITEVSVLSYVQYSESDGRPFLYKSFHALCSRPPSTTGPNVEILLDLSDLAAKGQVVSIVGEDYVDPNPTNPPGLPRRIDYWSSYYDQATDGFSTFAPHGGRFHGAYFYRGAQSMFDVHRWTGPAGAIFADGFESGDTTVWSSEGR